MRPKLMNEYDMKHLIDPTDPHGRRNRRRARTGREIIANRAKFADACRGRKLATLFYEPSTRTRLSFTSAMLELGGTVLGFSDAGSSSVSKGETVADTVCAWSAASRTSSPCAISRRGAPLVASQYAGIPVINAGDGSHSHPTQTLTDLLTIKREKGRLDRLTIGFCGDLKFGRTVHSLLRAMSRYEGTRAVLISPEELRLPEYMFGELRAAGVEFREVRTLEEAMPELDILYMTRVQKERFADAAEYERVKDSYVLDAAKMRCGARGYDRAAPLPRVNEIAREVDNDPRAAYFRQVENGKFVRMALIYHAAAMGGREPAVRPHAPLRRRLRGERIALPEQPLHLRYGGRGPAVPPHGRGLALRLLRKPPCGGDAGVAAIRVAGSLAARGMRKAVAIRGGRDG